jgi:dephospho-CoA kinase
MSFIVGITGGIGSGKSAATHRFEEHGITVVDADVVARIIVEPGTPALAAIAAHFGSDILCDDGSLDRTALRRLVFADESERRWLEQLTHPLIGQEIVEQISASDSPYTVLSSPLLLDTNQQLLADCIVVVDAPEALQLQRTAARDSNDEAQVKRIMAAQMGRDERLQRADIIIDNSGSLEDLNQQVDELHKEFLLRAENKG